MAQETPLSVPVPSMEGSRQFALESGTANTVTEGPAGTKVTRFDSAFGARTDLAPLAVEPRKFDLIKVEIKADRGAFLRFSLENFPEPGQLSHRYTR